MNFSGKNIVITGATSGIGLNLLDYFARRGDCNVCAVGRDEGKLERLKNKYHNKIFTVKCDTGKKADVDNMFKVLFKKSGNWPGDADIFIANAGFGYYEKIDRADWRHIENIFSVNCFSPIYSLLKMREYKKKKEFQFVMICSGVARIPLPGYSLYSATKAALDAFAKAYFNEKSRNIVLSMVYPVAIGTSFYRKDMKEPLMRQSMRANIENIIKGIYYNEKFIYPSPFFKAYIILKNYLPLTKIYVFIEKLRFISYLSIRSKEH